MSVTSGEFPPYRLQERIASSCSREPFHDKLVPTPVSTAARDNRRACCADHGEGSVDPPPPIDRQAPSTTAGEEVAILAGGCFWGVQGVFQHVNGVMSAVSAMPAATGNQPGMTR